MNFKKELLNYFEDTEIPAVLSPDKVSSFVKPRTMIKKAVETTDTEKVPQSAAADAGRTEVQTAKEEEDRVNSPQSDMGASAFIKVVFYHRLSRNEFLSLLTNTKISEQSFREIKENPKLTVKGLIDILEKSPLTADDYNKLTISAERTAQLKAEAREKLKSEEPKSSSGVGASPIVPPTSSKPKLDLNKLTSPKTQEMPPIKPREEDRSRTNEFSIQGKDKAENKSGVKSITLTDDNGGNEREQQFERKEKPKRKLLFGKNRDEDFDDYDDTDDIDDYEEREEREYKKRKKHKDDDEDDFDEDDDFDDDYEDKPRSNKGKFVAAAIGAVILIGISLGLRYYYTGSVLPHSNEPVQEEEKLTEDLIFDYVSDKSAAQLMGYNPDPAYTVGGIREENPLKQAIATEKRLVYISGNSLYIFEQIGGQTDQLDVRNYPADIKLLGLAETEKGIAVVTLNDGEPYTFIKTVENSEETGDEASQPETVSDSVTRAETVVELLDKDCPEKRASIVKYRLSGTLSRIFKEKSRLIVLTEENIPTNCSKEDYATFMPYVLTAEGRKLCSADNAIAFKDAQNSAFTAVFSLDFENETAIFCTAGSLAKASALNNGLLYLAAGDQLVQLAVEEGLREKNRYGLNGTFEDFSEICVSSDSGSERCIRVTFKEEGGAALAILDGELKLINEVKNLGNGEAASATCFYKDQTYIVTESGKFYGIDGNNQAITESSVKINNSSIYPLSLNENEPIGIKLTPTDENGKRTGLIVNTVKLDGTETEVSSTVISSKTVAKNALDEYLSSPAEKDIFTLGSKVAADNSSGIAVIPVTYFDGVSEVELFAIYTVMPDGSLSVNGSVAQYDSYSKNIFTLVKGDYVIAVTDKRIITAKAENGNVTSYYDITPNDSEYKY